MPEITQITVQTKNKKKCNLFVDGEFFAGVSIESIIKNGLKVGQHVDAKELTELLQENERAEALSKAADYISKALKTKNLYRMQIDTHSKLTIRHGYIHLH